MALDIHLKISGIDGSSLDDGFTDWFDIGAFDFAQVSSGPKAKFTPLTVAFEHESLELIPILKGAMQGKNLPTVELVVTNSVDVSHTPVVDILLSGATLAGFGQAGKTPIAMAFGFKSVSEVIAGSAIGPGKLAGKFSDVKQSDLIDFARKLPGADTLTYYLNVDGVVGGSQDKVHQDWFDVTDFTFGEAARGSAHKPAFADLQIEFKGAAEGLTDLFDKAGNGDHLKFVELEGMTGGKAPIPAYDLTLSGVTVTMHHEHLDPGGELVADMSFKFTEMKLEFATIDSKTGLTITQSFTYNAKTNKVSKAGHAAFSDLGLTFDEHGGGHRHNAAHQTQQLHDHGRFDPISDHHGHGGLIDA